jgi:hypothetical protein
MPKDVACLLLVKYRHRQGTTIENAYSTLSGCTEYVDGHCDLSLPLHSLLSNSTRCKWQTICLFHRGVEVDPHTEYNATCRIGAPTSNLQYFPCAYQKLHCSLGGHKVSRLEHVERVHSSVIKHLLCNICPHYLSVLVCDVLCTSPSCH